MSDVSASVRYSDGEILQARGAKRGVDPRVPYTFHVEPERAASGKIEDVATIFLTNSECPFRCLMCDLWQNTTDAPVSVGAIPEQIDYAVSRLPAARHIKLYNSGNFFDRKAIPPDDYPAIARRVAQFETLIVENHPKLCTQTCVAFRKMLEPKLEIALGLETVHPVVLPLLNKQMTADDFRRAAGFLRDNDIAVRAFILLRPPFLDEEQGVEWAVRSLEFAFACGAGCCSIIPTRGGNGIMEVLQRAGQFAPPSLVSLERVLEEGLAMNAGRVFVDLWDADKLVTCPACGPQRLARLQAMNLSQMPLPLIECHCGALP